MAGEIAVQSGIDLGMTNSELAVLEGNQIRLIPGEDGNEVIPSVVHLDEKGVAVGSRALSLMILDDRPGETFRSFKRRMGHDHASGSKGNTKSPVRLSSEVLKAIRECYRRDQKKNLCAAVVTFPARFEPPAQKATEDAAKKAGLLSVKMLQEPVAAALAYGFGRDQIRDYVLVVDYGGGTFDIAMLGPKDDHLEVFTHGGHPRRGGYDLDKLIYEKVAAPWLDEKYDLKGFADERSPRYGAAYMRLMFAIELAKIELSEVSDPHEKVFIRPDPPQICNDDRGRRVLVEIPITRQKYEEMIGPAMDDAIVLCREVLSNAEKKAKEERRDFDWRRHVRGILLVGGVTNTPYLRNMLKDKLRLDLDTSVNPMTVVARGAAIHAASYRIPDEDGKIAEAIYGKRLKGKLRVEIHAPAKASEPMATVIIHIAVEEHQGPVGDFRVKLRRGDGGFVSGSLAPDANGNCLFTVELMENQSNHFEVEVLDERGDAVALPPEASSFDILHLAVNVLPTVPTTIRVGLIENKTVLLVEAGTPTPTVGFASLKTAVPMKKGKGGDVHRMPILTGDSEAADRNIPVGELLIHSDQVERDIPVGSPIDLTIHVSPSGEIQADALVHLLNRTFSRVLIYRSVDVGYDLLDQIVSEARKRFDYVSKGINTYSKDDLQIARERASQVEKLLEERAIKGLLTGVEEGLEMAKRNNDDDARDRAYKDALDLLGRLDEPVLLILEVECEKVIDVAETWHEARVYALSQPDVRLCFAAEMASRGVLGLEEARAWYWSLPYGTEEEMRSQLQSTRDEVARHLTEMRSLCDEIRAAAEAVRAGKAVDVGEFLGKPDKLLTKAAHRRDSNEWSRFLSVVARGDPAEIVKSLPGQTPKGPEGTTEPAWNDE
jgi:molecular chaperone DnaK